MDQRFYFGFYSLQSERRGLPPFSPTTMPWCDDWREAPRQRCHISDIPNEVLALIFSCLPLSKLIMMPKLRLRVRPYRRNFLSRYRRTWCPQIIVLAWVSRQFRRAVHEHSFWQNQHFDFAAFIADWYIRARLPGENGQTPAVATFMATWLEDQYFRSCLERKLGWAFSDLGFFTFIQNVFPDIPRRATRLSLGTLDRAINPSAFFNRFLLYPNVTVLKICAYKESDCLPPANLAAIRASFPSLKILHISDFFQYRGTLYGNLHDLVGLTELVLDCYTGHDKLIPYRSHETLTSLSFRETRFPFDPRPESQLKRFRNVGHLKLYLINWKLKTILMDMPSNLVSLEISIPFLRYVRNEFDHQLFAPPCFQTLQVLNLTFELGTQEDWVWFPHLGRLVFESLLQQITSLRCLQKVFLCNGLFDPVWLGYFRNLKALRKLVWSPWSIYLKDEGIDESEMASSFDRVMNGMLSQVFEDQTNFQERPNVVVRFLDTREKCQTLRDRKWVF